MKANSEKGTPIKAVVADLGGAKKFTVTKNGKFLSVPHWGTPLTASKFVEEGKLSYLYRSPARVNDNWSLGMTSSDKKGQCRATIISTGAEVFCRVVNQHLDQRIIRYFDDDGQEQYGCSPLYVGEGMGTVGKCTSCANGKFIDDIIGKGPKQN